MLCGDLTGKEIQEEGICVCRWLSGKDSSCNAGDVGLIPWWVRSNGEGKGNPLQYFCLGNPWTEEPGQPQWMEPQKVRHNLGTEHARSLDTLSFIFIAKLCRNNY